MEAFAECKRLAAATGGVVQQYKGTRLVTEPASKPLVWKPGQALWTSGKTKFTLSPDRHESDNQTHFVALYAAPGSGKSWTMASYMRNWQRLFPKGKIVLFSCKTDDTAFADIVMQHFDVETEETPFSVTDVKLYQK